MDLSGLKIGTLHSLIGKNDGVSIVIDQIIETMVDQMKVPLGNLYFLAGHSSSKINTTTDDCFWHRNEENKYILKHFSGHPPKGFDEFILENALYAKRIIRRFVEKYKLDVFIIHNGCHPSNFIYSVAAGMYFEELRKEGRLLPKYLLWWHDSHFERDRFAQPNEVIQKYLRYIPGANVDGIVFINSQQAVLARTYLNTIEEKDSHYIDLYIERKTCVIPNTCDLPWDFKDDEAGTCEIIPPMDRYNRTFIKDLRLIAQLKKRGFDLDSAVLFLQHTRVVTRKRIDHAIDFIFEMGKKFKSEGHKKCMVLLVSGHSGDEHDSYRAFLENYFVQKVKADPEIGESCMLIFAEHIIMHNREVIVDRKYYRFFDIPSIIANMGGMGTYFSEVEGYGNNLLEMLSWGLPVAINRYPVYKSDIESLGFLFATTQDGEISRELIETSYQYLTNPSIRRHAIQHNLQVLKNKLNHGVMAKSLLPLIENLFIYR